MSDILFDLFNTAGSHYDDLKKICEWSKPFLSPPRVTSSPKDTNDIKSDGWRTSLDLPGFSRDEITITIESDTSIQVTAESDSKRPINEIRPTVLKTIRLPSREFNLEDTVITFKEGVLRLEFSPKQKPEPRTLKISD